MIKKPILSDHDKRNVLSAKKKQKVVLKNMLVQPFERYWPELTVADADHFAEMFGSLYKLSPSDNSTTNTNTGTSTKTVSQQNVKNNQKTDFANKVILGLRSSIRCVSSGNRLALFISSKIRPKYVVDQIIVMALTKNTNSRVFCVPHLDETLLKVLGFSCQCLAILESQNEIWNWIIDKSKQFPLPTSFEKSKIPKIEQMEVEYTARPATVSNECIKIDVTTLYLRKENSNERAFTPSGTISRNDTGNDFISLGVTNVKIDNIRPKHQMISKIQGTEKSIAKKKIMKTHNPQFHANKVNYLTLKVNRVQPNSDKIRKKKKNKKNKKLTI